MRELFFLLFELLSTLVKLARPGGSRTVWVANCYFINDIKELTVAASHERYYSP
jgi:hypothetical protein